MPSGRTVPRAARSRTGQPRRQSPAYMCSTGTPSVSRALEAQSVWKVSSTACGSVTMTTSRAPRRATSSRRVGRGSSPVISPVADDRVRLELGRASCARAVRASACAPVRSTGLQRLERLAHLEEAEVVEEGARACCVRCRRARAPGRSPAPRPRRAGATILSTSTGLSASSVSTMIAGAGRPSDPGSCSDVGGGLGRRCVASVGSHAIQHRARRSGRRARAR